MRHWTRTRRQGDGLHPTRLLQTLNRRIDDRFMRAQMPKTPGRSGTSYGGWRRNFATTASTSISRGLRKARTITITAQGVEDPWEEAE